MCVCVNDVSVSDKGDNHQCCCCCQKVMHIRTFWPERRTEKNLMVNVFFCLNFFLLNKFFFLNLTTYFSRCLLIYFSIFLFFLNVKGKIQKIGTPFLYLQKNFFFLNYLCQHSNRYRKFFFFFTCDLFVCFACSKQIILWDRHQNSLNKKRVRERETIVSVIRYRE